MSTLLGTQRCPRKLLLCSDIYLSSFCNAITSIAGYLRNFISEDGTLIDDKHHEQGFIDAGFVDIKIFKEQIIIGDWCGDPINAPVGRAVTSYLNYTIPSLAGQFKEAFPEGAEGKEYGKNAFDEYYNSSYHLYSIISQMVRSHTAIQPHDHRTQAKRD